MEGSRQNCGNHKARRSKMLATGNKKPAEAGFYLAGDD